MKHKVWFGGDLHKRVNDISTIRGYVKCNEAVQRELMKQIEERGIDIFVSLGDWYDKGYAGDVAASLFDYDLDLEMSRLLKGQFYGMIGNHIRLGMDSNPELHLIQPHPLYKSRRISRREEQIIKTPDILRIGNVQISFMHHNMSYDKVEMYKPQRKEWAKYHIALFHTPKIVPNAKLANTVYGFNTTSNTAIGRTLEGVDLAIVGDIHTPIGRFPINKEDGTVTTMIVPGSLSNTDASENNRHTSVSLPLVEIDDETDEVTISFVPFDLKTNMLTFEPKNRERAIEKIKTLRGKSLDNLHSPEDVVAAIGNSDDAVMSFNGYMTAKGYTPKDRKLVQQVMIDPIAIDKLVAIYAGEE